MGEILDLRGDQLAIIRVRDCSIIWLRLKYVISENGVSLNKQI